MTDRNLALVFYILEVLLWIALILWGMYMIIEHPFDAVQTIGPLSVFSLAYLFHRAGKKFEGK